MDATQYSTAWEHLPTRKAWGRTVLFWLVSALVWTGGYPLWLFAVVMTPVSWVWFWMIVVLMFLGGWLFVVGMAFNAVWARRVLKVYPWQILQGSATTDGRGYTVYKLPDPDKPSRRVDLHNLSYVGIKRTYWERRVRAGKVPVMWFAGDARFIGVLATPGPRNLMRRTQHNAGVRPTLPPRMRITDISQDAIDLARAAGVDVDRVARNAAEDEAKRTGEPPRV